MEQRKRRNKIFSPAAPEYQNLFGCPNFVSAGICLSVGQAICADRSRNRRTQILRAPPACHRSGV
jgi:hypothetical protein